MHLDAAPALDLASHVAVVAVRTMILFRARGFGEKADEV